MCLLFNFTNSKTKSTDKMFRSSCEEHYSLKFYFIPLQEFTTSRYDTKSCSHSFSNMCNTFFLLNSGYLGIHKEFCWNSWFHSLLVIVLLMLTEMPELSGYQGLSCSIILVQWLLTLNKSPFQYVYFSLGFCVFTSF